MSKRTVYLALDAWYPQMGGPNVVVSNYYKHLTEGGDDCKIVVPTYGKKQDANANAITGLEPLRCKGIYVPFGGFYNALPDSDKKLQRLLNEQKPNIYHSHSPFNLGKFFAQSGKKQGVPSILTFHTKFKDEFLRITKSKVLTEFMMKRIMKVINMQDYVWTVSNGSAETLREYGYKGDITVIRNGTDMTLPADPQSAVDEINREYDLGDCENVILFVGRIVRVKNLQLIFNALKHVKSKASVPIKTVIVGDGSELNEYKRLVKDLGLDDSVLFVGEITDREKLKGFYLRADLFAFPSTFDTASLCPIEAATFSLPTLLIKNSPTSEIVSDGVSGFCEIEDAEAWANKIIEIFENKPRLKEIGDATRKTVYRSWQNVVDEVKQHYDAIIAGK